MIFHSIANVSNSLLRVIISGLLLTILSPFSIAQNVFTVTNTLDSGDGSLRAAIEAANSTPNAEVNDVIQFDIDVVDTAVIIIESDLPSITDAVTLDGLTQTGASCNMLLDTTGAQPILSGSTPNIRIVIQGQANTLNGLTLANGSDQSIIRGLAFQNLAVPLRIESSQFHSITCNYFGFSTDGITPEPNNGLNIILENANNCQISNNLLGASSDILPGDLAASIVIGEEGSMDTSPSNEITANVIGANTAGVEAGLQKIGVSLRTGISTLIYKNLIAFNKEFGVQSSDSDMSTIKNNAFIDNGFEITDLVGAHIAITSFFTSSSDYIIGDNKMIETGTDSLNTAGVLLLAFFQPIDNINIIGNEIVGTTTGILMGTISNTITDCDIDSNTIYNQKGLGIAISSAAQRINLRGNSLYNNGSLGISLSVDASTIVPTPNDFQDIDAGANGLQNYPVIDSAKIEGDSVTIYGSISTAPSISVTLEFFSSIVCNPDENGVEESDPAFQFGEGRTPLGTADVSTNISAESDFVVTLYHPNTDEVTITATATSSTGTSEFSRCKKATFDQYTVVNTNDSGIGSLRFALDCIRSGGTIDFSPAIDGDTITLTSGPLDINKDVAIDGRGVSNTIIGANSIVRAFSVADMTDVSMNNLTILAGSSPTSAAILNAGVLSLESINVTDTDVLSDRVLIQSSGSGSINVGGNVTLLRLD